MKIASIETLPVRIRRDLSSATGTAGTPTALRDGSSDYRWSEAYPCLYSVHIETALVKLTTEDGLVAWGEAQAPLAPEVACTIIDRLLRPVLVGMDFSGEPAEIDALWWRMYSTMRVRGQTGGFMLDAISALDLALWDLAGKIAGKPVSRVLAGDAAKSTIPAYISGLPAGREQRLAAARRYFGEGFGSFKLFFEASREALLDSLDSLQAALGDEARFAVDALWRFRPEEAVVFGRKLDERQALWFEAPLLPEDPVAHGELARAVRTPIAIGESYRTTFELAPFFRERAVGVAQPDLGRCGITEGMRIARLAAQSGVAVVPHISIAFGPQAAAALHFAAAAPNCHLAEYNPRVLEVANRFLRQPICAEGGHYTVPQTPGLGAEIDEAALSAI